MSLVDDNLENIRLFCRYGGKLGIIFDRPWNQSTDTKIQQFIQGGNAVRCKKWEEIPNTIDNLFKRVVKTE